MAVQTAAADNVFGGDKFCVVFSHLTCQCLRNVLFIFPIAAGPRSAIGWAPDS